MLSKGILKLLETPKYLKILGFKFTYKTKIATLFEETYLCDIYCKKIYWFKWLIKSTKYVE